MYTAYFDAGVKQNKAVYGFVVLDTKNNVIIKEGGRAHPIKITTNVVEYISLINLLKNLVKNNILEINIYGDSQTIIYQLNSIHKIKSKLLMPYFLEAKELISLFKSIKIEWIPRKENKMADAICRDYYSE